MATPEHERLTVDQKAVIVAARLDDLARGIPERRADLRLQLLRASSSIPLNVAEGASEFSPGERAKYYRIARRSAAECMAVLDVLAAIGVAKAEVKTELHEIIAMLSRMIRIMHEKRARGP